MVCSIYFTLYIQNGRNGEKSVHEGDITNWCITTIDVRNLLSGGFCLFGITWLHFNQYINHKRNHINIWRFRYLQYSEISKMLIAYPHICWGTFRWQRILNLDSQTSIFEIGIHFHDVISQIFLFHQISNIFDIYLIWKFLIFKIWKFGREYNFSSHDQNYAKKLVFRLLHAFKSILGKFRVKKPVWKTYSFEFTTFWIFQHQKWTNFCFRLRFEQMPLILSTLLRKRHKPSKDCILASEILYIYPIRWEITFFLFSCAQMAAKKSTFQPFMLFEYEYFIFQFCNRFPKCFRWFWPTTQHSKKDCILTGEILYIDLTRSNIVEFKPFLACMSGSSDYIIDTENCISRISEISNIGLIPSKTLLDERKKRILASEILDIYPLFRKW